MVSQNTWRRKRIPNVCINKDLKKKTKQQNRKYLKVKAKKTSEKEDKSTYWKKHSVYQESDILDRL